MVTPKAVFIATKSTQLNGAQLNSTAVFSQCRNSGMWIVKSVAPCSVRSSSGVPRDVIVTSVHLLLLLLLMMMILIMMLQFCFVTY